MFKDLSPWQGPNLLNIRPEHRLAHECRPPVVIHDDEVSLTHPLTHSSLEGRLDKVVRDQHSIAESVATRSSDDVRNEQKYMQACHKHTHTTSWSMSQHNSWCESILLKVNSQRNANVHRFCGDVQKTCNMNEICKRYANMHVLCKVCLLVRLCL